MNANDVCERIAANADNPEAARRACLKNFRSTGRLGQEGTHGTVRHIPHATAGDIPTIIVDIRHSLDAVDDFLDSGDPRDVETAYALVPFVMSDTGLLFDAVGDRYETEVLGFHSRSAGQLGQEEVSMSKVRAINNEHGKHFFDPDTMRFFDSIVESPAYSKHGEIYFITSEMGPGMARRYTLRAMDPNTGNVTDVGGFQRYRRLNAAMEALTIMVELPGRIPTEVRG